MISIEIIKELLNIKTNNTSNDRFLKIMRYNKIKHSAKMERLQLLVVNKYEKGDLLCHTID